ncbi:lysophospholipase [Bdellovibrionota bacterium FG-2]
MLSNEAAPVHLVSDKQQNVADLGSVRPKGFPGLPSGWRSEWETFPSQDGKVQLFTVTHHPANWDSGRVLLVIHGLGEHGGRYLHFPHYLSSCVDAVCTLDLRGHGRSEGSRGHVDCFDQYVEDVAVTVKRLDESLKRRFGRSEIHILGHSLGGLVVLKTLFLNSDLPIRSAAVSCPLLGMKVEIPVIKKGVALALSRIWGSVHFTSEVNPDELSHDPAVAEAYTSDRLVHRKVTPRLFAEMRSSLAETAQRKTGFKYPLLVLVSMDDKIVDPAKTCDFFKALELEDKMLKQLPGFYHEPFNEVGKELAFEDLKVWIQKHIS